MMTTLTIDKPLNLKKTHFKNSLELYYSLQESLKDELQEDEIDLDFRELREDEITPEILKMAKEAQLADPSEFIDIR